MPIYCDVANGIKIVEKPSTKCSTSIFLLLRKQRWKRKQKIDCSPFVIWEHNVGIPLPIYLLFGTRECWYNLYLCDFHLPSSILYIVQHFVQPWSSFFLFFFCLFFSSKKFINQWAYKGSEKHIPLYISGYGFSRIYKRWVQWSTHINYSGQCNTDIYR